MRTFIALELPERFRFEAAALARKLGQSIGGRFIAPGNYHVTLAFLGDVGEREAALAMDALDAACDGAPAPLLACNGLGKFGKANDATLWLGLQPTGELVSLASAVREELVLRGVSFDAKPFKAHITIARRSSIPKAAFASLPFPEPDYACAATLFKSELDSEGATYTPIHSMSFTR